LANDQPSGIIGQVLHEIEAHGPRPFITHRVLQAVDGTLLLWNARRHRKNLPMQAIEATLWQPKQLNWWIGLIFMIGAFFFALGSVLCLAPSLVQALGLSAVQVNTVFFIGSIPFTTAAYLQLYQAANAPDFGGSESPASRPSYFGWKPRDAGWMSCVLQFFGTILFNMNTFDGIISDLNWVEQDLLVWVPNFVGSVLFLASGYLAFIETCHAYWAFRWRDISWWVTSANLVGCIAFMISACFAFVPQQPAATETAFTVSISFTLLGAIGFFVGSLLMWPEITSGAESVSPPNN
jgi:hypothetical protein